MQRTAAFACLILVVAVVAGAVALALLAEEPDAGWRHVNGELEAWLDGRGEKAGDHAAKNGDGGADVGSGDGGNLPAKPADGAEEAEANDEPGEPDGADGRQAPVRVNINRATAEELDALPGIGPAKARAIIEYRETYGRFETPEQLMEVKGIGKKTFERLKDLIEL